VTSPIELNLLAEKEYMKQLSKVCGGKYKQRVINRCQQLLLLHFEECTTDWSSHLVAGGALLMWPTSGFFASPLVCQQHATLGSLPH
jgi:hypothetical protein